MHLFRAARARAIRDPVRTRNEPERQRAGPGLVDAGYGIEVCASY